MPADAVVILAVGGPTALGLKAPSWKVDALMVVILAVGGPTALVLSRRNPADVYWRL